MTKHNAILSSIMSLLFLSCGLPAFAFETLIQQTADFPSITPSAWLVDVSDFNLWNRERFSSLGDTAAVPEPDRVMLLLFAFSAIAIRVKQRNQ